METPAQTTGTKTSILTKKRYKEIEEMVRQKIDNESLCTDIMKNICEIMHFKSDGKAYCEYHRQYYQQHKQELNRKRTEARRSKSTVKNT